MLLNGLALITNSLPSVHVFLRGEVDLCSHLSCSTPTTYTLSLDDMVMQMARLGGISSEMTVFSSGFI